MDRLPTFKSVFCLSLETSAKIIGYIHMILFGLLFAGYFSYHIINDIQRGLDSVFTVVHAVMTNLLRENALLVSAFFAGSLLIGIHKKNSDLVLSWLLLQIATLLISIFTLPFTLIPNFIRANYVLINLQVIAFIAIKLFALLIVNSYYLTLSRGNLVSEEDVS